MLVQQRLCPLHRPQDASLHFALTFVDHRNVEPPPLSPALQLRAICHAASSFQGKHSQHARAYHQTPPHPTPIQLAYAAHENISFLRNEDNCPGDVQFELRLRSLFMMCTQASRRYSSTHS